MASGNGLRGRALLSKGLSSMECSRASAMRRERARTERIEGERVGNGKQLGLLLSELRREGLNGGRSPYLIARPPLSKDENGVEC